MSGGSARGMYEAARAAISVTGNGNPDYEGLLQSEAGALARYEAVLEVVSHWLTEFPVRVLDLGCGTGGFLQYMVGHGYKPVSYTGVDYVDHRFAVERRLQESGVSGTFELSSCETLEGWVFGQRSIYQAFDVAVACAVAGPLGYSSYTQIQSLQREMSQISHVCALTLPKQLSGRLGDVDLARFAVDDVKTFLRWGFLKELSHDIVVGWEGDR